MAGTYYKYAERDADSQINWAEVGKEASGMLLEVNRVREEKKEAYNQATREELNNLMSSPQGQDQNANAFINNYAHDMIQQMKIDEDLFKRGMLKERDYTLRRQNNMDGTNQLFEIQKLYQEKYAEKMDGVTSGKLQAMNVFNMGMVEGYGDFNNSRATVNPNDGTVGIGLMENKMIDGKMVRVLSKNIAPVNVIRGKILQDVPTFDVNKATADYVKGLGSKKDYWYNAASTSGAGTITELTGVEFLRNLKRPEDIAIVNNINNSINQQVDSYFAASPYNLSSVLTENTGKYNADSFTFDKEEAAKDSTKILVKIDPNTSMTTLDDKGPNYKKQKEEASEYVRTDIISKMDAERTIKTTAQEQLQESSATKARAARAGETPPPPTKVGEILALTQKDKKGNKVNVGVSQRIENLVFPEGKGIENVATNISYNSRNGALELSGYQITGKESEGTKAEGEGISASEGTSVVKQKKFIKNDISSASLLSTMVLKIPNPERPGYNFSNIKEAKSYYKRQYESQTGKKELD